MVDVPTSEPARDCRYQAAIVRDGAVLLLRVRSPLSGREFWLVPGGGLEAPESQEECIRREVHEETRLVVDVDRLLWEEHFDENPIYRRARTFLCRLVSGEASPGTEPETDHHLIEEVGWFPLDDPATWGPLIANDPITHGFLTRLRHELAT